MTSCYLKQSVPRPLNSSTVRLSQSLIHLVSGNDLATVPGSLSAGRQLSGGGRKKMPVYRAGFKFPRSSSNTSLPLLYLDPSSSSHPAQQQQVRGLYDQAGHAGTRMSDWLECPALSHLTHCLPASLCSMSRPRPPPRDREASKWASAS